MTERSYVRALFDDPMLVGFRIGDTLYSPKDVEILFAQDSRTNPETCRHAVVQEAMTWGKDHFVVCVSCDSTLDSHFYLNRKWEYDIDHNVWIYVPDKKKGPTIVNTPPTPGRRP